MSYTPNNKDNNQRTLHYLLSGVDNPSIDAVEAAPGTLYLRLADEFPELWQKQDHGLTTNWLQFSIGTVASGVNVGTGAQVLKSVVASFFKFRTLKAGAGILINQNANEIEIATSGGGTSEICVEDLLTTNSAAYEDIGAPITLPTGFIGKIEVNVLGRKTDTIKRAYFKRVGFFNNVSGTVVQDKPEHYLVTDKNDLGFNIRFSLSGSNIQLQVKAPTIDTFYWKATQCILDLST